MKLGKFILIVTLSISSLAILVSGKPSSRRLKNQRNKETEVDTAKDDASGSATSAKPAIGSLISSNGSDSSVADSVLTLPTSGLKPKKLKKSHRLKHRRFGHHHKKHNRRSHNHRAGNRRHHNSTKDDDPTISTTDKVIPALDVRSSILNSSEPADLPSLKLLRSSRSGHRKFKRHHHHHHHRPQSSRGRLSKKAKEQLAGETKEE